VFVKCQDESLIKNKLMFCARKKKSPPSENIRLSVVNYIIGRGPRLRNNG